MKYIASTGNGKYIAKMAWFSDTFPIITLETSLKERAIFFENNEKEKVIASKYPNVKFLPVVFSVELQ